MSGLDTLTFEQLRLASADRAKSWKSKSRFGGSDETVPLSFNMCELAGEVGEAYVEMVNILRLVTVACNTAKKLERTCLGLVGGTISTLALEDELGDIVICTDLVARKLGLDLGKCVREKFNKTSAKHGFEERL